MRIIDLSMTIYPGMPVYPGDPEVKIDIIHTYDEHEWQLRQLKMGTHTGTHVDAFSHMHAGKASIDRIPLERFCGPAQVVERIDHWPENTGLLFIDAVGIEEYDRLISANPGFVGGNISEALERALLNHNIITYTELVNLEVLPTNTTFMFYGFPLKIKEGDGSPVRAIAILEE